MSDMESLSRGVYGFPHDKIIYDQEGNPLKLGVVDGRTVPPFGQKSVKKVRDLSIRDDDILLVGYPKTGCHWTWEILNMIVSGKAGYSEIGKNVAFLEFATTEMIESYPGRRVPNTHLWFDYLPKQITEKKIKMVLTVRNPKDTAVSYYNHHKMLSFIYEYNGTFKGWFPLYLDGQLDYGSYFDYYQRRDQEIKDNADQPILVVSCEDMKEKALGREDGFAYDKVIYDQDGHSLKIGILDGKYVPPLGERSYRKVRDLNIRDDDIIFSGVPENRTMICDACLLELILQITEKKTKIVFIFRNSKDTVVSYYNHHLSMLNAYGYDGPFKNYLKLFIDGKVDYGSYFDFHQHWDRVIKDNPDLCVFVVSYEDMKENLPREIKKLSEFIDVTLTDEQVDEIAKAAGFDVMKEAYNKQKNLSNHFIRKGQVGEWKNWLTVAESEAIDALVEGKFKDTIFSSPRYFL